MGAYLPRKLRLSQNFRNLEILNLLRMDLEELTLPRSDLDDC